MWFRSRLEQQLYLVRAHCPTVPTYRKLIENPQDYVDQQDGISTRSQGRALVQNNDFIGVASYNIFVGIAVATIFGSGFFFDLFWPERHESASVKMAWKICSIVVSIMALADAIAMTVRLKCTPVINQMLIT